MVKKEICGQGLKLIADTKVAEMAAKLDPRMSFITSADDKGFTFDRATKLIAFMK